MPHIASHEPQTFVLVHGAHQGGWCYKQVAAILRSMGHSVFTPTLSGLAERSRERTGLITLSAHINEIVALFKWEDLDEVVLCGHSYGGMVVGGVADKIPERIRNLVYLDAIVPENGKSVIDYMFRGEALHDLVERVGQAGHGYLVPTPAASVFNVNAADREMVDRLSTPHPFTTLIEKIVLAGNADRIAHHTFIYASDWDFAPIREHYERAKTLAGWKTFEINAGHDIMIDAPNELADLLVRLD